MEVAYALAALKKNLRRTIVFAAFDAEEKGLLGAEHYVANPVFPIADTVYMINLDMVGYVKKQGKIFGLGGLSSPSAATMIQDIATKYPSLGNPSLTADAGGGSDHVPFAGDGVPIVFFHTGTDVSPYHQTGDTPDKIDYKGVTDVSKLVVELIWKVAQADTAPDRSRQTGFGHVSAEWSLDHGVTPFMK
jgi:Zn-dependent M28 family amino/carboxypeptidase